MHIYELADGVTEKNFTVKLTVTDNRGATSTAKRDIKIVRLVEGEINEPKALLKIEPTTVMQSTPEGPHNPVNMRAWGSYDLDGFIEWPQTTWTFIDPMGDTIDAPEFNGQGEIMRPFGMDGEWTVTVVVYDEDGNSDSVSKKITVLAEGGTNQAPVVVLVVDPPNIPVGADFLVWLDDYYDVDGWVETVEWSFDGVADPNYTGMDFFDYSFDTEGPKDVTVTVTDDQGATTVETVTVNVIDDTMVVEEIPAGTNYELTVKVKGFADFWGLAYDTPIRAHIEADDFTVKVETDPNLNYTLNEMGDLVITLPSNAYVVDDPDIPSYVDWVVIFVDTDKDGDFYGSFDLVGTGSLYIETPEVMQDGSVYKDAVPEDFFEYQYFKSAPRSQNAMRR